MPSPQFSRALLDTRLELRLMSSPLARPRAGGPRHFVKRSPGNVGPAKMLSREEAAELMMRTEFSAFSRGADADASASATPEKRPGSAEPTRAAATDKVAARLVANANARAKDAERRAFETEERAAARVADAEHALGDAQRVIAQLEHHVAETAMRRDERESVVRSKDETADDERAKAVAEANRRRLQTELELDASRAELEDAEKATAATKEAARRALEAREKDARAKESELTDRIVHAEAAFERERALRVRAEETAREHERRRVDAIESVLRRAARRGDEPSASRAALLRWNDSSPRKRSAVELVTAEEELVAVENERTRELERLRGEVVAAKAETSRAVARAEASAALVEKARREGDDARRENARLCRAIDRSNATLGAKGASVALNALDALDAIEARATATYRVAQRALDLARRSCDAAEDVVSSDALDPAVAGIERRVEGSWAVVGDVLSEAWRAAGETRGKLDRARDEASVLSAALERAATREADARVGADVEWRSRTLARPSATDASPKISRNAVSDDAPSSGASQKEGAFHGALAGSFVFDDRAVPRGSAASEARGRSPVRRPAAIARSAEKAGTSGSRVDAGPRRTNGFESRTPSPARASPSRSSLSRSPNAQSASSTRALPSPGARRRVTFGEVTTSVFSPARGTGARPRSAPARGNGQPVSRVGAYIRGETSSVVSATEEKRLLAGRAAIAAAERADALARAKASNLRSRTAQRPWHTESRSFGSTAQRRPPSARSERCSGSTQSPSPLKHLPRRFHSIPGPHPPPRDAAIASQRSPSKSPPLPGSQRHRDAIVSRTTLRL